LLRNEFFELESLVSQSEEVAIIKEIKEPVRWLFPIRGLRLLESSSSSEFALNLDADLWTKNHTFEYLNSFHHQNPNLIPQLSAIEFDSCLFIKHRSPNLRSDETFTPGMANHYKLSRDKAAKALTALHFCVMSNASPQSRCVFADSLPVYSRWDIVADRSDDGIQEFQSSMDLGATLERTREQLQTQFTDAAQSELFRALGRNTEESRLPKDVRHAVSNAASHLSRSCHEWSESSRLLIAITSIEMLMSVDVDSSYAKLQNRIEALIGADSAEEIKLAQIFSSRHQFVHNGIECASSKQALRLAATCLINFTNLGVHLLSASVPEGMGLRNLCLQYLDMLYQAQRLESAIGDPLKGISKFCPIKLNDLAVK